MTNPERVPRQRWTTTETEVVKQYYETSRGLDTLCTKLPHRTRSAIMSYAFVLGLKSPDRGPATSIWTPERIAILREHYPNEGASERLQGLLGLGATAIYGMRNKLKIKRKENHRCRTGIVKGDHPSFKGYKTICGRFYSGIQKGARHRNLPCSVSIEYISDLLERQQFKCALTGLPISFPDKCNDYHLITASLDRIDSSKGYVAGNVQWVHKDINQMKWDFTPDEFLMYCRLVANHNPS